MLLAQPGSILSFFVVWATVLTASVPAAAVQSVTQIESYHIAWLNGKCLHFLLLSFNVTSLMCGHLILQVFRTEHYSHAINTSKKSGALGLIAVIVYTIAAVALMSCAIAHPGEIQNTILHPQQAWALMTSPAFPSRQIAFTGLLSTDFVIYIEVCCASLEATHHHVSCLHSLVPVGVLLCSKHLKVSMAGKTTCPA